MDGEGFGRFDRELTSATARVLSVDTFRTDIDGGGFDRFDCELTSAINHTEYLSI